MATVLVIIHVVCCLFLISIVLLQSGKGAEMGAAFGGSSQTIFGSRGASTFLNKLTTASAIVFMLTSLTLSMVANKHASVVKGVRPIPAPVSPGAQGTLNPQPQPVPQQPIQQPPAKK